MKKSKIIAPALGVLILSTAASISGTVAWFTANNSVQVTGMTVKTKVGNNLLIANDSASSFDDTAFGSSLEQARSAKLEPVSTIDGVNFYYTTIANDNGTAKANSPFYTYGESTAWASPDADAAKANYDAGFNTKYIGGTPTSGFAGTVVYGYVDYTFYLKASFTGIGDKLIMNDCNFLYDSNGSGSWAALGNTDKAWRVSVFAHAATATTTDGVTSVTPYATAMADADRVSILAPDSAAYNALTGGTDSSAPDAVSGVTTPARGDGSTPTYADVKDLGEDAVLYTTTQAAEVNKVFKVVVRLWLEGEDTKCFVDNYRALSNNYKLDLSFKTEDANAQSSEAVSLIKSVPQA